MPNDSIDVLDDAHAVGRDAKTEGAERMRGLPELAVTRLRSGGPSWQTRHSWLHIIPYVGGRAMLQRVRPLERGRQSIKPSR